MKHRHAKPRRDHSYTAPKEFLGIPVFVDEGSHLMADSRGVWPWKKIVLGMSFFYLGAREKEAVLLHEAAHCRKFHLERRIAAIPLLFLRPAFATEIAMAHELEADRFAAERGFAVELLAALRKLGGKEGRFYPTFDTRAKHLNKFIKEKP